MEAQTHAITWEAPEHHHIEKTNDWFWALGILALGGAIAAFLFGNFLFAILILVGAGAMALQGKRQPRIVPFMVGTRGVRVGERLFPYSALESYKIDEESEHGMQLLLKAKSLYMPLIIIPIPEEHVNEIEVLVRDRLSEEELEEPLAHKILEMFGF